MSFTERCWDHIKPMYGAILNHPFITELTDGSLAEDIFIFYLKQDAHYLADFSRALSLAGARSEDNDRMLAFFNFATNALNVERALHGTYFESYGATLDVEKSPTCMAYTNFLLSRAAVKSNTESIAALLPCFWIYREVGLEIVENAAEDNPYKDWIDTYSGEEFNKSVEQAIDITDKVAEETTEAQREKMLEAFEYSTRLEWMFWDSAYKREKWKPEV